MILSRREILFGLLATAILPRVSWSMSARSNSMLRNNFKFIYGNPSYRQAFFPFLQNVFHLYPEEELDAVIAEAVATHQDDETVYKAVMAQLPAIKPALADLTMAIPALKKQKEVMTAQTLTLLGKQREIDGYLEFGSSGRYLDALEEQLQIDGPRYLVTPQGSTYSPVDIVDRGQILKAGTDLLLDNYAVDLGKSIPANSLDMVTVYIGFHHCPLNLRDAFIDGIRSVLKPGGALIVRDHNADSEHMHHVVALAHDVFNLGTNERWDYNESEFRSFYSLDELTQRLKSHGFSHDDRRLFQDGDPTLNALMLFRK